MIVIKATQKCLGTYNIYNHFEVVGACGLYPLAPGTEIASVAVSTCRRGRRGVDVVVRNYYEVPRVTVIQKKKFIPGPFTLQSALLALFVPAPALSSILYREKVPCDLKKTVLLIPTQRAMLIVLVRSAELALLTMQLTIKSLSRSMKDYDYWISITVLTLSNDIID